MNRDVVLDDGLITLRDELQHYLTHFLIDNNVMESPGGNSCPFGCRL
jgi:hypothetical protein